MENNVGLPVEYKVLVLPDVVEEKTAGGIYLAPIGKDKEQLRAIKGVVIASGPNAYEDWKPPVPQDGDRVMFAINSGMVHKGDDGKSYRIISDKDIIMILDKEKSNG